MRRVESAPARGKRALAVLKALRVEFPDVECALTHRTPHELLVATILSAQCTDVRVNIVTRDLFEKYRSVEDFARADIRELEREVHSTGFFRNKARNILGMSREIIALHGSIVPRTMEELTALPGVGRKTANVILGNAFGIPGMVVDTHVMRLSNRLGFSRKSDPVRIEADLCAILPEAWWTEASHLLIHHGRKHCPARSPRCETCPVRGKCPSAD